MMGARLQGVAMERIPYGARVLCRKNEVSLAGPEIANGTASDKPDWFHRLGSAEQVHEIGDWVSVEPIEGLGERDLHAIAAGPIMEPCKLYLPAGKLTEAEYQQRLALDFERAGIAQGMSTRRAKTAQRRTGND